MVIAYGEANTRAALSPRITLGAAAGFQSARASLGGTQPELFVSFAPLARLAGSATGEDADPELAAFLRTLRTLASAPSQAGRTQASRTVLTLR